MKKYIGRYVRIFLVCVTLLISGNSFASHIVGMDLFYTYVPGTASDYTITLVAFGDCGPASASAFSTLPTCAPRICIYNGGTYVTTISLTIQAPATGAEITPVCVGTITQCSSSSSLIPGVKKFVYKGTYTVPVTSHYWRFLFTGDMGGGGASAAGRAAAITNIMGGTNTQLVDTLDNTYHNNSNPLLTIVPTPFFCLNNFDSYTPGAVEPDGDSLNFMLVPGMSGSTNCTTIGGPVTYMGTYTAAAPLGVAPGTFAMDPHTGEITFFPNILQRALVVYNIQEYRNDTFIGTSQREMTFLVQVCVNPPPIGGIVGASSGTVVDSTHFNICAGTGAFDIIIHPTEADTNNLISVHEGALPSGAVFSTVDDSTNHPLCTFSWTTAGLTPGSSYVFYINYTDNNCPLPGSRTIAYTITILPLPAVDATGGGTFCEGTTTVLSGTGALSYTWTPGSGLSCTSCTSPVAGPLPGTTIYTVTGTDVNGCKNTDTVSVTILPMPVLTITPDTSICLLTSVGLAASGPATYSWTPGAGLSCTTCSNPTASPTATTTYTLTGTGVNGCSNDTTVTITVNPLPVISTGPNPAICIGSSAILTATGGITYSWSPATGLSATTGAGVTASPTSTTIYTVTGINSNGCSNNTTITVSVNPLPVISTGPGIAICIGSSTILTAAGGSAYSWSPASGLSATLGASVAASPSITTTYTVTGINMDGCMNTATVTVTINPLPSVSAGPDVTICRGSSTTLTGTGASTYSWTPATGLSATTGMSILAGPVTTTVYTVTGTSPAGCMNKATVKITVDFPTISLSAGVTICGGGTATLFAGGSGTGYSWSPGTGISCTTCTIVVADPSITTVYTVTATDALGCHNSDTVRVSVVTDIDISAPTTNICIGTSAVVTATGATTYTWSPGSGLSCTNCTSPTANPPITTTYTITGTTSTCHDTDTVTVFVNPLPVITAGPDTVICDGSSAVITATGGSIYSWAPSTGLPVTTGASVPASPSTTTTYMVTGTSLAGCSNAATVTISVNPSPTISAGPDAAICIGSSAAITAAGGITYSWSPVTGLSVTTAASVVADPVITTTYTVTGTNSIGCSGNATVTITINPLPAISAGPGATVCIGSSVALTATGGSTYSWGPPIGLSGYTGPSVFASPSSITTYTVTGVSSAGCVGSATVTVAVDTLPVISGSGAVICNGASATISAAGGSIYSWSPSTGLSATTGASVIASPSITTTYLIIGTSLAGCVNMAPVTVTVNLLPVVTTGPGTAICNGSSATLTAYGGSAYSWSPSAGLSVTTGAVVSTSPSVTTTYTVTGTSGIGCSNSAAVTVIVNPIPVIGTGAGTSICRGSSTTLWASGGSTYSWTPSTGLSASTGATVLANPATTTTYSITGTSAAGCTNDTMLTVTVNPLPVIGAMGGSVCPGASITLVAFGGVSYIWSPDDGLSCVTCFDPVVSPTATVTYAVTGYNAFGCQGEAHATIIVQPAPVLTISPSVSICPGTSTTLTAGGAVSYVWGPTVGLIPDTGSTVTATPPHTIIYSVTGTDANNCKSIAHTIVTVLPSPPGPNVVSPVIYCKNAMATKLLAYGQNIMWYADSSGGLGDTAAPVPNTAITGTLIWYASQTLSGCESPRVPAVVTVLDTIAAAFEFNIKYGCYEDTVSFINTSQFVTRSEWSFGDGEIDTTMSPVHYYVVVQDTTLYPVQLTGYNPCFNSKSISDIVRLGPTPARHFLYNVTPDAVVAYGGSVQLNASGAVLYTWVPDNGSLDNPNINNPVARPLADTTYMVYGRDINGCLDSAVINITLVHDGEGVPDAFTPDADGLNDVFRVHNLKYGKVVDFNIYNRWGQLIFHATDNRGWDGKFQGVPQDLGIYFYAIKVSHSDGKIRLWTGDVTLIR